MKSNDLKLVLFERIIIPLGSSLFIYSTIKFYFAKNNDINFDIISFILLLAFIIFLIDLKSHGRKMVSDYYPDLMIKEKKLFITYPPKKLSDFFYVLMLYVGMVFLLPLLINYK